MTLNAVPCKSTFSEFFFLHYSHPLSKATLNLASTRLNFTASCSSGLREMVNVRRSSTRAYCEESETTDPFRWETAYTWFSFTNLPHNLSFQAVNVSCLSAKQLSCAVLIHAKCLIAWETCDACAQLFLTSTKVEVTRPPFQIRTHYNTREPKFSCAGLKVFPVATPTMLGIMPIYLPNPCQKASWTEERALLCSSFINLYLQILAVRRSCTTREYDGYDDMTKNCAMWPSLEFTAFHWTVSALKGQNERFRGQLHL